MDKKEEKYLKRQIAKGKSLNEVVMSLGKSKSTILQKANELGLRFKNTSYWSKL